jgi:hypothetical protein
LSAVSARPFRAPWVETKYCSTVRPSRKLAVMGVSMISPEGLAIRPRMPANWRIWSLLPRAPESAIMKMGLKLATSSWWTMVWPGLSGSGSSTVMTSRAISSIMRAATSSVALAQMSTTLLYFSPSVMMPS